MEYLLILVLAVLLVVLILAFRPTHRASAMRQAMHAQRLADAAQARRHREFAHMDIEPQRAINKHDVELIGALVGGGDKGKRAAAWAEKIIRQGGKVWIDGQGTIFYSNIDGSGGNKIF
ncbi:MAG: hypothetical protein MOGMAGMI_02543 [Candidatus Omnitrophica bacterium]|nr:hypothetical protein [Candidatus Omnitrophota bacterium]